MTVLVDTNVIIDFLVTREPYYEASSQIIAKCASGELKGYIAFHSVPNLWYILRKIPESKRRTWILDICSFMQVTSVPHKEVLKAVQMENFKDLEDCLQDRCAINVNAQYIITRNMLDFTNSEVPAILPENFLKIF